MSEDVPLEEGPGNDPDKNETDSTPQEEAPEAPPEEQEPDTGFDPAEDESVEPDYDTEETDETGGV